MGIGGESRAHEAGDTLTVHDLDSLNDAAEMAASAIAVSRAAQVLQLVDIDEVEGFRRDGAASLSAWLRTRAGLPSADASRLVRLVRLLRRMPQMAEALRVGAVSIYHLEALERVATGRRVEFLDDFATQLTNHAAHLDHRSFNQVCQRWAEHADNQLDTPDDVTSDRWLHLTPSLFGTADIRGHLTPDQAALVGAALNQLDTPDPTNAPVQRTVAERRADALAELAHHYLGNGPVSTSKDDRPADVATAPAPGHRAARPTGVITVSLDDIHETARARAFATPDGELFEQIDLASIRRDLMGLGPITKPVADLMLCDASVKRLVLDTNGQPLNIGRTSRTVTPTQRRALAERDHGCVFPTCDRPAAWCDAHHLVPWSQGGPTDLTNLGLLCRHHHRLIHGPDWELERHPETGHFRAIRSDGTIYQHDPTDETLVIYHDHRRPGRPPDPWWTHEPHLEQLLWPT